MNEVKTLLEAAELLTRLAREKQGGMFPDPKLEEIMAVWEALKEQYRKEDEARVDEAKCYETHKYFWKAAEREHWPSNIGGTFWSGNYKTAQEFTDAVLFLYTLPEAQRWLTDERNAKQLPQGAPKVK